jgi:hypothetical protein
MSTMPAMRLRRLVSAGYFPLELPPPFTTAAYADHAVELADRWDGADIRRFWTSPEHYSIPRHSHVRRKLSLTNLVNFLHVAHLISENWHAIRERLQRSKITQS